MMRQTASLDAEYVILGGGCAGLSLAARLVQQKQDISLIVVEPRAGYQEDRTWCGWRIAPHFFSDCVVSQWNQWRIITPYKPLLLCSPSYPYEMVRANLVYEKARNIIERGASAKLLLGAKADGILDAKDHMEVQLADGRTIRTSWIIDTRPQARVLKEPWLWQNFVGYVVACDPADQVDTRIPSLMEFQEPGNSVARFMYTIPLSDRQFLFECTRFSRVCGEEQELEADLHRWLDKRFCGNWKLQRREAGSLPMAPPIAARRRRVIPAGTRGGNMRISTGYAFHRIQRWADVCTQSILANGIPLPPASDSVLGVMDELFLRVLQQPSTSAAQLFGDLFEYCPTERLVRFLAGVPRLSDLWPVASSLPWGKFLRQLPMLASSWIDSPERTA